MVTINDVLQEYNIIGMAIAVAIGIAGQEFIFSLNNDVVMPSIAKLIPYGFFKNYKFDIDKFVSKLFTFAFVFGVIIILFLTVLKPLVKEQIDEQKELSSMRKKRLEVLEDIEKKLTTDVTGSLNRVHQSVVSQTDLIKNSTIANAIGY